MQKICCPRGKNRGPAHRAGHRQYTPGTYVRCNYKMNNERFPEDIQGFKSRKRGQTSFVAIRFEGNDPTVKLTKTVAALKISSVMFTIERINDLHDWLGSASTLPENMRAPQKPHGVVQYDSYLAR